MVLDTSLTLLGFGAEIRAGDTDGRGAVLTEVIEDGSERRRSVEDFGTRHRSAFRLCFKNDAAACIVVSSDGGVRGVKRVGAHVRLWPEIVSGASSLAPNL